MNASRKSFRGTLLGIEYDDPDAFEAAARGMGWTSAEADRRNVEWRVGTPVRVQLDGGGEIDGQVWSRGPRGWVWLALDDQTFAAAHCQPERPRRGARAEITVYRSVTPNGAASNPGGRGTDRIGRIGA